MPAIPVPSAFESRCNATYDALMWALSRPGLVRDLPEAGQAQIVDALIDRDCAVFCDAPDLAARVAGIGAALVDVERADHLFLDRLENAGLLRALRLGSDLHPELGETLVLNAAIGTGPGVRLTGPGVDGSVEIRIAGLPDGFWRIRAQVMRYPMGFELFLLDGTRVVGLPRSTEVEVL
ncbi:phosphonate C-P lyase system protein PhnH [Citreimonas sp.]|uniref:phosphonate C-P lyase system protein PhnH n=1 Tax=Citreimonas sp. TaxID=3036715 RepID=UPI0035C7B509